MTRLFFLIYSLAGTVLAGSGLIAVLVIGWVDLTSILLGAGIGAAAAVPVAWGISRRLAA
ncbi:hypothetical protein [Ostreiculturibacter nitratireducens]|uniref:hypothetical protein n=1 Tax=Ostreiculturibacter nitratireducens TaxID=3075226 RepID=UPI0031B5BCFF